MTVLLVLLGIAGLAFALVNLVSPGLWGISNRKMAGLLLAGSLVVMILGAALSSPEDETTSTTMSVAQPDTTTTSSPVESSAPTTTSVATSTLPPQADAEPDPPFVAPSAGPSGDPDGPLDPATEVVMVVEIIDGDTLDVVRSDGTRDTVRLIGINAPERGECWSAEATSVLTVLTSVGAEIGMTVDESDRDRFDRLLRFLWVGSMSVNEELVRRGAAISRRFPPDTARTERLDAAQEDAMEAGVGLWAPNACGPSADGEPRIVDWRPDAVGNDNDNLNDEWIQIGNEGSNPLDLTGWVIRDESTVNRYPFPGGFTLAPGEVVTVYSGCGEDFGTDLYWCSVGSAIWNNDGDTAFLLDPAGNTHTSETYSP